MPALETQPVWNHGQCPVNPPSHTWAEDGGESPGVSSGFRATDTNPYSDLSSSTPTATGEVFSLRLDPERWPRCLVLSSCQEGCLPFWPWDPQAGRPERRGVGEHGWPPGATGWPAQAGLHWAVCLVKQKPLPKAVWVAGISLSLASAWATVHLTFLILSVVPWLQSWLPGSAFVLRTPCTTSWCRVALGM